MIACTKHFDSRPAKSGSRLTNFITLRIPSNPIGVKAHIFIIMYDHPDMA
ncbi:hypothetical protein RK21_02026 [Pseudomonas plecoglossicida]|nr:hypothetical protein RK21_02026 [Pseudomonas plecoglossicida]